MSKVEKPRLSPELIRKINNNEVIDRILLTSLPSSDKDFPKELPGKWFNIATDHWIVDIMNKEELLVLMNDTRIFYIHLQS